ncbi:MAG: hypothetical protein IKZ04_03465, partial [Spirochaetaceae bacterium]|nr:hypothetical protein [Spirochaetaceae bacterium]
FICIHSFFSLDIISPVPGTWANKQPLILDVPESCEVFYSFTGSDPLNFGFAYDGPVLIDAEGSVPLLIAIISPDGSVEHKKISYNVRIPENSWNPPFNLAEPFLTYSCGDVISIPEEYKYCLGKNFVPDISGRTLVLGDCPFPSRYIPCTVTNENEFWRFVISTKATSDLAKQEAEIIEDEESIPPFIVSDWDYITFNRKKLIYCIDDGFWSEASGSVFIDRSVPHKISWQSVAYSPENTIYSIELPAKPQIKTVYTENSSVVFEIGNGYTVSIQGYDCAPVSSIAIDAFYGEHLKTEIPVNIFYNSIYHGSEIIYVDIDKEPPAPPVFTSSSDLFYNRQPVTLDLNGADDSDLFYSVNLLSEKSSGFSELELTLNSFDKNNYKNNYLQYDGNPIKLDTTNGNAVLYSVSAYSCDSKGNKSSLTEYKVIIDPYNYYISSESSSVNPDGSLARPFSSLKDFLEAVDTEGFKRVHLDGIIPVSENIVLSSKYEFHGINNVSGFKMLNNSSIALNSGAQVAFTNCVLELNNNIANAEISPVFFNINNANVSFIGCEIVANFIGSGSIFVSDSSAVSFDNCGVTVKADRYSSLFSGVRTNLTVNSGRYTVIAPTAVIFSLSSGVFSLTNSDCKVYSNLGRVAELSGVSASISENNFTAELTGDSAAASRVTPVWFDGRSKFIQNTNNSVSGFPGGSY